MAKRKRRSDRATESHGRTKRKRRTDRAYLIYKIVCTVNAECYVGLVVRQGQAVKKTLARRLHQHVTRAMTLGKNWSLHVAIRKHGAAAFTIEHVETVRGKGAAHRREVELMAEFRVTLNTSLKRS